MNPEFVTLDTAAELLAISKRTLYRMVAEGELPKWKKIRGRSVMRLADIKAYSATV